MIALKWYVRKATYSSSPLPFRHRTRRLRERLTSTKCTKVLSSLWHDIGTKDHFNATGRCAANSNIEEADGVCPVFSSSALYEDKESGERGGGMNPET